MPRPFTYRRGQLSLGPIPMAALARRFGTPLYVYGLDAILDAYGAYDRAFARVPHQICAAVKANGNRAILRALARAGAGFDIVSGGELTTVLAAGGNPARVVFSGVGKTAEEMDAGLRAGIGLFNVESAAELAQLAVRARRLRRVARFGLRLNPDVAAPTHRYIATGKRGHKFGIPPAEALALYRQYARHPWLHAASVGVHIGSQILTPAPFAAAVARLGHFVAGLQRAGCAIEAVDIGGGLGIAYRPGERTPAPAAYARAVFAAGERGPLAAASGRSGAGNHAAIRWILEPGRSLFAAAGLLLTRVLYIKHNAGLRFVILDAGFTELIRPALYGAYHEIWPVRQSRAHRTPAEVVGPVCETADTFAHARPLPPLAAGDLVAILDAGAYGYSLASNYNARPRPAEIGVQDGRVRRIRRRETFSDLLALEP